MFQMCQKYEAVPQIATKISAATTLRVSTETKQWLIDPARMRQERLNKRFDFASAGNSGRIR